MILKHIAASPKKKNSLIKITNIQIIEALFDNNYCTILKISVTTDLYAKTTALINI